MFAKFQRFSSKPLTFEKLTSWRFFKHLSLAIVSHPHFPMHSYHLSSTALQNKTILTFFEISKLMLKILSVPPSINPDDMHIQIETAEAPVNVNECLPSDCRVALWKLISASSEHFPPQPSL